MEVVIALGIFAITVVAASGVFLLTSRAQRKEIAYEQARADARFAIESMAREVRNGSVDYAYYAGPPAVPIAGVSAPRLALVDQDGRAIAFYLSDAGNGGLCADAASRPCLLVQQGAGPAAAVTAKGVKVLSLNFYISPAADPYAYDVASAAYAADSQPTVTIVLATQGIGDLSQPVTTYVQTTVASRIYKR